MIKKIWKWLWSPSKTWALGALLLVGFVIGGITMFASHKRSEWPNSEQQELCMMLVKQVFEQHVLSVMCQSKVLI